MKSDSSLILVAISALFLVVSACNGGDSDRSENDPSDTVTSNGDEGESDTESDTDTHSESADYLENADWEAICVLYASCTADFEKNFGSLDECVNDFMVQFGSQVGATCNAKCGAMKKCENSIPCVLDCQEDATRSYCSGYSGNELCCQDPLPSNYCQTWSSNGKCDCGGKCSWDEAECAL